MVEVVVTQTSKVRLKVKMFVRSKFSNVNCAKPRMFGTRALRCNQQIFCGENDKSIKQAGAELCQAQDKLS